MEMPEFSEQSLGGIPTNMFYLIKGEVRSFCIEKSFFISFNLIEKHLIVVSCFIV